MTDQKAEVVTEKTLIPFKPIPYSESGLTIEKMVVWYCCAHPVFYSGDLVKSVSNQLSFTVHNMDVREEIRNILRKMEGQGAVVWDEGNVYHVVASTYSLLTSIEDAEPAEEEKQKVSDLDNYRKWIHWDVKQFIAARIAWMRVEAFRNIGRMAM